MEAYKKSMQSLIKWVILGLIVSLCITVGLYIYSQQQMNKTHICDFIHGIQTGIFTGLFLGLIFSVIKIKRILKDESSLKQAYIKSHDERSQFIFFKIGTTSFYIETFILFLGIIISGFFNATVAITLLAVLFIKLILKKILKVYFEKAY